MKNNPFTDPLLQFSSLKGKIISDILQYICILTQSYCVASEGLGYSAQLTQTNFNIIYLFICHFSVILVVTMNSLWLKDIIRLLSMHAECEFEMTHIWIKIDLTLQLCWTGVIPLIHLGWFSNVTYYFYLNLIYLDVTTWSTIVFLPYIHTLF